MAYEEREDIYDETDKYFNDEQIEELLEDDEISSEEAGFMLGYNEA